MRAEGEQDGDEWRIPSPCTRIDRIAQPVAVKHTLGKAHVAKLIGIGRNNRAMLGVKSVNQAKQEKQPDGDLRCVTSSFLMHRQCAPPGSDKANPTLFY